MQSLIENLKKHNLKVTPQRLIIYSYLYNNPIHPSAETIYNNIKEENPTISLATVYKTLNSLKEAQLIQLINIGEDSFRYDIETDPHFHIICKKCNNIKDYYPNNNFISSIKDDIERKTNFKLNSEQMYFYGICEVCETSNK